MGKYLVTFRKEILVDIPEINDGNLGDSLFTFDGDSNLKITTEEHVEEIITTAIGEIELHDINIEQEDVEYIDKVDVVDHCGQPTIYNKKLK